jgi:competence protein ComFC
MSTLPGKIFFSKLNKSLANPFLDLLYPPHCHLCGTSVASGQAVCEPCISSLPAVRGRVCEVCSQPFAASPLGKDPPLVCGNCRGRQFHFVCCLSAMQARGPVRDLIHRLKYQRATYLAELAAQWMEVLRSDTRLRGIQIDALIPVPLHPRRQRERGYNQALLLAEALGRRWQIPVVSALRRVKETETQTHFDRDERMRNLRGAFEPVKMSPIANRNLFLVDDVFTTGSTLEECAATLLRAGGRAIWGLTLARA